MDKVMVETSRIRTHCFVSGPEDGVPVLLVHGNITTGRFWQDVADGFPDGHRLVAPRSARPSAGPSASPVDATRGLRDWSDDLHALVEALGWAGARRAAHRRLVQRRRGGAAVRHRPRRPSWPPSPWSRRWPPTGSAAARTCDGTPCWDDWAGTGGGTAAPDSVRRMAAGDASEDEPGVQPPGGDADASSGRRPTRRPTRTSSIGRGAARPTVGDTGYPGDATTSPNWPGVAPGRLGGQQRLRRQVVRHQRLRRPGGQAARAVAAWRPGPGHLRRVDVRLRHPGPAGGGARAGRAWRCSRPSPRSPRPGPCWTAYAAGGGSVRELAYEGCGHCPPLERSAEVREQLLDHIEGGG